MDGTREPANETSAHGLLRDRALSVLREHGPLSRTELAHAIGLSRSTTINLAAELLRDRLVVETFGRGRGAGSGSGRPAKHLAVRTPDGMVVGFDFGHRHLRVAIANKDGAILAEHGAHLDVDRHAAHALDAAGTLYAQVLADAGVSAADVRVAAAGIPGPLNSTTNRVGSPTILASWVDLDLVEQLGRQTGLRFVLANDAVLGAVGEMTYGVARDLQHLIYVKASNGIGAALVLDGRVYRGSQGMAGEIGHTQIDPGGPWCRCGNRGCLEATVSIDVVRRQLEPLGLEPLDPDDMRHPVARKVLAESGRTVGIVIANLCNALNPQAVVLGGDLGATGATFTEGVADSVRHLAQPGPAGDTSVLATSLAGRAELLGAITYARRSDIGGARDRWA